MSRTRQIATVLCFAAAVSVVQTAKSGALKEKIVFVHADPSQGVTATRILTDIDTKTGTFQGTHAAPEFEPVARANQRGSEIGIMNADGSGVVQFHVSGTDPAISPDGKQIVFCSVRDNIYFQIYVMNSDGSSPKRLTDVKTGDACGPAWSHDGKKIAFHAYALTNPNHNPDIWTMDADGSNQKRVIDHGIDPTWSPNDKQIAFASSREPLFHIYSVNADGSNLKKLTSGNQEDSNPSWAPDGGAIVYSAEGEGGRRGLFIMGADGSDPHRLAFSKHQDFCFPTWSPDGKTIAFTTLNRVSAQPKVVGEEVPRCEAWSGEYQIFTMDSEGKTHQLTDTKLSVMRPSYGRVPAQ